MFPVIIAQLKPVTIVLIIFAVAAAALLICLYFLGKKSQEKKEEQDKQAAAMAQTTSMLIIDKKKMRLKDAGLPAQVYEQTPWYARMSKVPIVKAKVGPKIITLIADVNIFDEIPVKKEVKATVSGLYITQVRGIRGPLEKPQGKKSFGAKMREKYNKLNSELKEEKKQAAAEKEAKSAKKASKKN